MNHRFGQRVSQALALLLVSTALAVPGPALADTFVLVDDARTVTAVGQSCDEEQCQPGESDSASPNPPFSHFNETVSAGDGGFAHMLSTVSGTAISGSGEAGGWSDIGWGTGRSTFDVSFSIPTVTSVDLTGLLTAEDQIGFGYSETTVTLYHDQAMIHQVKADPFSGEIEVDYDAVLAPGSYRLTAVAEGDVWMYNTFSVYMIGAAVPVPVLGPVGVTMLALGLLAGGAWGRGFVGRADRA